MRPATELLVAYARHHRDRRNPTTHLVGVPMIIASLGMVSALWVGALLVMAHAVPQASGWLVWGVGLFIAGWAFQFLGHYYEGGTPAFVDDLTGLAIAPLFLSAEVLFALGWNRPLQQAVESEAGPLHLRDLAHP